MYYLTKKNISDIMFDFLLNLNSYIEVSKLESLQFYSVSLKFHMIDEKNFNIFYNNTN